MNFSGEQPPLRVGISASNVFAPDSDGQFAYQIMLARMQGELKSPKHSRESMLDLNQDWMLLSDIRARGLAVAAERTTQPESESRPAAADSRKGGASSTTQASSAAPAIYPVAHGGDSLLP